MSKDNQTARSRYTQLATEREPYLRRAREAAKVTIPSMFPEEGHTSSTVLPTPFQGLGARGVNFLASKFTLALIPPNSPFFRLVIDDYALEQLTQQEGMRAEVEEALSKIERTVTTEVEAQGLRIPAGEAIKQLILAGNCLTYLAPEGGMKTFRLDRYVVKRDPMGTPLEIIVKEDIAVDALPEDIADALPKEADGNPCKTVEIYTSVKRTDKEWEVYQEVEGKRIESTKGTYPLDKSPWIPLRFTRVDGEDYGRGYVEEYLGDIKSLEALTQAIVEGSAMAAKVLFLVNPNGSTKAETLTKSPNGAVRAGFAGDVSVLQVSKGSDFSIALQTVEMISQRLSYAFLMNSSVQRGGERVTAEEIRYVAGELEDALGGVYSILSQEFQLPLITRLMFQLEEAQKIPMLPQGVVSPTITTGIEALGRGHDLTKLNGFIQSISQALGPEVVSQYLNVSDYISRTAASLGIDAKGLVKTEEDIQAEQQAAQQAQMMEQMGGAMGGAMGDMAMMAEQMMGGQEMPMGEQPMNPDEGMM